MARFLFAAVALTSLGLGCASDAAGPGARPRKVDLSVHVVTVPDIGGTVPVTAHVAGATIPVVWRLVGETRWLGETPVVVDSTLGSGRIVTAGPGDATLEASAPDAEPDTLRLRVAPVRPLVLSVAAAPPGSLDTFLLRGFGLSPLTTATVEGTDVPLVVRDSATVLLILPGITPASCAGSARMTYTILDADVAPEAGTLARARPDEFDLAVGEARRLAADATCLRVTPHTGAAYALAYLDPYLVQAGRTNPTEYYPVGFFDVALTDRSRAVSAAAATLAEVPGDAVPPPGDVVLAVDNPFAFPNHPVPWQEGDVFDLATGDGYAVFRARVMAVVGDYLVIVFPEADTAAYRATYAATMQFAAEGLLQVGVPYLQRVLASRRVVTNPQMNQLMLIAQPAEEFAFDARAYSSTTPYIAMRIGASTERELVYSILAHEAAHVWQSAYVLDVEAAGQPTGVPPMWGVEGGADLARYEIVRESMGIAFDANWEWVAQAGGLGSQYADAVGSTGWIAAGYSSAAGMLRDFIGRLMKAGVSYDEAAREVLRSSLNGWFGCRSPFTCFPIGLADRMRAHLGGAWTAEDAVLRYALSHAADDLTSSPDFQIPSFFAAYRFPGRPGLSAWNYTEPLVGGSGATVTALPSPYAGSAQYFTVQDDGRGGSYALSSSKPLLWMVVRLR